MKKRILLLCNYKKGVGGISGQVAILNHSLNKEQFYEARIFSLKTNMFKRILLFFKLLNLARGYDVLHIHACSFRGFLPVVYGVLAGKLLRKKIIVTYHGGNARLFFRKHKKLITFFLLKTDANIVLSEFLGIVFDEYKIPYTIIPNILEKKIPLKNRMHIKPYFVCIRTLSPLYNVECILKAYKIVKEKLPESKLTIIGDGQSRESLVKMVEEEKIKDVEFVGKIDNSLIYDYLQNSDIMLSSPLIDNMPVSILEGFNAGLLVISSNVGGVPFIIDDNINGLLFDSNDYIQLSEKMLWSINNENLAIKMVREAQKDLVKYSWETVKNKLFLIYNHNNVKN